MPFDGCHDLGRDDARFDKPLGAGGLTCDDRATAARLGGHQWNILNNQKDHYLLYARSREHFVDPVGNATSGWFARRGRVDPAKTGVPDSLESKHIRDALSCPRTAGKAAGFSHRRQVKQLCQATAPTDFGGYLARRSHSAAPPTPTRPGGVAGGFGPGAPPGGRAGGWSSQAAPGDEIVGDRYLSAPSRIVDRSVWATIPKGQVLPRHPPKDRSVFTEVDQLRAESHGDVSTRKFAAAVRCGGSGSPGVGSGSGSNMSAAGFVATDRCAAALSTDRSLFSGKDSLKPQSRMLRHSAARMEATSTREVSDWPNATDKLKRGDPYHTRPVQQICNSGVKYDIVANTRRQFHY